MTFGQRLSIRLAVVALVLTGAFVAYQVQATLDTLEHVERERDRWQRPDVVIQSLTLKEGDTVVDFGSGAGYFALRLAPVVGTTGVIVAVDIRPLSLAFLEVRAWKRGLHQIRVLRSDVERPRLPPAPLDAVLIVNTYHELDGRNDLLRLFRERLESGGRLVVADRREQAGDTVRHDTQHTAHAIDPDVVEHDLRGAGFEIVARDDRFIDRPGDHPWWLIVARRP